jgi:hypothetical protein
MIRINLLGNAQSKRQARRGFQRRALEMSEAWARRWLKLLVVSAGDRGIIST